MGFNPKTFAFIAAAVIVAMMAGPKITAKLGL